ncbi:hypothetical protein KC335_g10585 [Hortaea werneckii]|nr:hypothetical protein KC335_g10585 [Hortaea werneckii]
MLPPKRMRRMPTAVDQVIVGFCATCERQIVTPCGSILYCSEACRRKDVLHTTLVQNVSPTLTPAIPATSEAPNVDIIP